MNMTQKIARLTNKQCLALEPYQEKLRRRFSQAAERGSTRLVCPLCSAAKKEASKVSRWEDICGYCPIFAKAYEDNGLDCMDYMPERSVEVDLSSGIRPFPWDGDLDAAKDEVKRFSAKVVKILDKAHERAVKLQSK